MAPTWFYVCNWSVGIKDEFVACVTLYVRIFVFLSSLV